MDLIQLNQNKQTISSLEIAEITKKEHRKYKNIGLKMNERTGKVSEWLDSITSTQASEIINILK